MLDNGKAEGARKIKQIEKYCLRDIAIVSQGFTFSRSYQGKKNLKWNYFKVADIGLNPNSKYLTNAINTISDITMEEIGALPFPKGSIVFPRVGAALFNNNKKILAQDGVVDDNVLVLTVTDTSKCWHEFLYYYLQGIPLAKWCNSGLVPVINTKTVLSQMVFLPPLPEQQKIAAILSTQDKVIELKEKLLVQKQQQKKYLMQQLLTGKKRLPGFCEKWTRKQLGELFENRVEINRSDLDLLAITSTRGILPRDCLDLKDNSSEDKSKYLRICPGDIGYNTMRMWQGVSAYSEYEGIVSPAYTILAPMEGVYSRYFAYLFKTQSVIFSFYRFSQGLVDDTRNLKYENFKKISVSIPSKVAEQRAIVQILSTADHEIDLLQKSIEAEKQKKKALMQLLLTGKVSVRI